QEQTLVEIIGKVLKLDRVGVYGNFFDLGGHSLLATQAISRVRDAFQAELTLRSLFEAPTAAALAQLIRSATGPARRSLSLPILAAPRDKALPLSFAQQRLWFLDRLEPGSAAYNMPAAVRLKGSLDVDALARTLTEVVRRHEVLRTTFKEIKGLPVQVISDPEPVPLPLEDLTPLSGQEAERRALELVDQEANRPFDLASGPLLRVRLLRLKEDEHLIVATMHHIVSDAWSIGILIREVAALYEDYSAGKASSL